MITHEEALWNIRGVQFIYPGAYIRIRNPFDRSFNITTCCYTKSKWTLFKKQYYAQDILNFAREAAVDVDGTASFLCTHDPYVPRLSGKGGCLVGCTWMTSPQKGTHVSFYFRAAEFTWRHSMDWLFISRLLELLPELPKPITVHLHYHKLFLNTLFLPMLKVQIGDKSYKTLIDMAYERIQRPWKRHHDWFHREDIDTSDPEKSCKLKATQRAMKWARGEMNYKNVPWDELSIE